MEGYVIQTMWIKSRGDMAPHLEIGALPGSRVSESLAFVSVIHCYNNAA